MASLSLPRVLQLKKNSLDAEREQFEKFQTLAIQKAINAIETPVKEKHVRSTIIGTFQEQSAITYWMVAVRLPFQDNRIVAWKFCHVTHKLLREGHPACLDDSQRHIGMIENLGKLWVHLREGYGKLVHLYCNLLVCKLKFHSRNPRFPGNMQLTADELDAIAENDVNNYFQLCVELFDYMEDILNLQAAVFDSLGNARANSMTASGQCRLAALIPCAQDASQIYDCNVRLLFRLHAALPPDTLAGHRERFRQQFKKLSSFYKHASNLQYYRNLLTLPVLPSNPPNFLLQSEFGTYVTPVVSIPEPPPDEPDHVGSLIDTSDTISQSPSDHMDDFDARPTPSPQPDPIVERDRLIDHLQHELKRMRSEVSQLVQERNTMIGSMKEHCTRLESQLQTAKVELEEEKQKAELLSIQTPEIKKKLTETEEKAKIQDEKFQKLKGAYTQLREEHITLIRQKAEVDKLSASLRAAAAQHESAKVALQQQLNDRIKDVELLQQSTSSSEEIEAYKTEILSLRTDLEQARQKECELETMRATMETLEIDYKTAAKEQEEKLKTVSNELKETSEQLRVTMEQKQEKEIELAKVKQELQELSFDSSAKYNAVCAEKDAALKEVELLTQRLAQEKQELTQSHDASFNDVTQALKEKSRQLEDVIRERNSLRSQFYETLEEFKQVLEKKNDEEVSHKTSMDELDACVNTLQELQSSLTEKNKTLSDQLADELDKNDILQGLLNEKTNNITILEEQIEVIKLDITAGILKIKRELLDKDSKIEQLERDIFEKESLLNKLTDESSKLNDVLTNVTDTKDEVISKLQIELAEKESEVISIDTSMAKLFEEHESLKEVLNETQAALEIGNDEILTLKEEHNKMIEKNDENISMKNQELRELHEKVDEIYNEKLSLEQEKERLISEFSSEKKVLETKLLELQECYETLSKEHADMRSAKETLIGELSDEIKKAKLDYDNLNSDKENEITILNDKIKNLEIMYETNISEKTEVINQAETNLVNTKQELVKLHELIMTERHNLDITITEKDRAIELLDNRLEHSESKRLNAECELQDLLQHNTSLEADLAAVKKQLELAEAALEKQTSRLVSCAGEAALEVTNEAITAFEQANAHDTIRATADLAAKALEQLARHSDVSGNEESVAKSAIFVAHNTAQLSAYVADVSNVSTNLELSEKLNNECRTMLTATKQCLESIKSGAVVNSSCSEAQTLVRAMMTSAALADRQNTGARSVDDELADMDRAIEEAASQIESLLAATRAGETGVKLEVNGKILDACTTLMGAVKILVQDARKLQNELGDPKTRQKMYRKNPQWSEGLISAAKAVVFAAKLLVTSADEAVGASGQVEGVSAAAHEVAGSTAQLVAASRARAPPDAPALARLTRASREVAAATGALVAAVKAASALVLEQEALDTSSLSLTATRRLEMESKVRSLKLETALDAERARLAALRKRHYQLAQLEENGNMENGKD